MATVRILILPYQSADGNSLAQYLVDQLNDARWTDLTAAVAFLNTSGNSQQLVEALLHFAQRGGKINLTFGADSFGDEMGSDYQALHDLLKAFESLPDVKVYLCQEPGRTFHPKLYLFYNEEAAVLIVGSSNWSKGGFVENVEANAVLTLDLNNADDKQIHATVLDIFTTYWRKP